MENKIELVVSRSKASYKFRADESKPDSFENNWKNNSIDGLALIRENKIIFDCKCQSVANYCFGDMSPGDTVAHGDTIAPGKFTLRCFVESRKFHGEIHAICDTIDIDGQRINRKAMQTSANGFQNGRWLLHDRYSFKLGRDTNCAWSAGCIIVSSADLAAFNKVLRENGIKAGDEIRGIIVEI